MKNNYLKPTSYSPLFFLRSDGTFVVFIMFSSCNGGSSTGVRSTFSKNTIVTGLTNDERAYFPTAVSFTQGPKGFIPYITGYETTPGSTLYEIGSGEKLAESAITQLNRIF